MIFRPKIAIYASMNERLRLFLAGAACALIAVFGVMAVRDAMTPQIKLPETVGESVTLPNGAIVTLEEDNSGAQ